MMDYPLSKVCFVVRQIDRYDVARIRGGMVTREDTYLSLPQHVSLADISSCGSVFAAALIHGFSSKWEPQFVIDFATMTSAFKATVSGDFSFASRTGIASLPRRRSEAVHQAVVHLKVALRPGPPSRLLSPRRSGRAGCGSRWREGREGPYGNAAESTTV